MKLTPELIAQAPSFLNAVKERQLDLRGHNIPAIENLGVTQDQYDCIDLTDNGIPALANLPLLRRLKTLLLANNRITQFSPSLHLSAPNLTSLILTNNSISELGDLESLREVRSLKYLSLLSNPVREKKWYREWLVFRLKSLRVLDFQRIRERERLHASALFLTPDQQPTALASTLSTTITSHRINIPVPMDEPRMSLKTGPAGPLMNDTDRTKVKLAIANAKSDEEIRKLEKQLQEGWIPNQDSSIPG